MKISSYFNPYVNHNACTNIKDIDPCKRCAIIITTLFVTIISLPFLGIFGMVAFRALVDKWKPKQVFLIPNDPLPKSIVSFLPKKKHKVEPPLVLEKEPRKNSEDIRVYQPPQIYREPTWKEKIEEMIALERYDDAYNHLKNFMEKGEERERLLMRIANGFISAGELERGADAIKQLSNPEEVQRKLKEQAKLFFSRGEYMKSSIFVEALNNNPDLEESEFFAPLAEKLLGIHQAKRSHTCIWKLRYASQFNALSEKLIDYYVSHPNLTKDEFDQALMVALSIRETPFKYNQLDKLGKACFNQEKYTWAEAAYKEAYRLGTYHHLRLERAIERKQWDDAYKFLTMMTREMQEDRYFIAIAHGYLETNVYVNLSKALECAGKLHDSKKARPILKAVAEREFEAGYYDRALQIELNDDNEKEFYVYHAWGEKLLAKGDLVNARKVANRQYRFGAFPAKGKPLPLLFPVAERYFAQREYAVAREIAKKEIGSFLMYLDQNNALKTKIGDIYFNQGNLATALEIYKERVFGDLIPHGNPELIKVAQAYVKKGDLEKGQEVLKDLAWSEENDTSDIYIECAKEYFKQNEPTKVDKCLSKVTRMGRDAAIMRMVARLLDEKYTNKVEEELDSIGSKYFGGDQSLDPLYFKLAKVLNARGDLFIALRVMSKIYEKNKYILVPKIVEV